MALEETAAELQRQAALAEVYANPERAKQNALELRRVQGELETAYERWTEWSE